MLTKEVEIIISEKDQEELNQIRKKCGFEEKPIIKNHKLRVLIG